MDSFACTILDGSMIGPSVFNLHNIVGSGGTTPSQFSVLVCVKILVLLADIFGRQTTSFLEERTDAIVRTTATRKEISPLVMAAWGLQHLRSAVHTDVAKVGLFMLSTPGVTGSQPILTP